MLKISNLQKSFGNLKVLKGINMEASAGEVIAVIGPSGTGKSTLLRCINYLEEPDEGCIEIGGVELCAKNNSAKEIQALRRKTAMVFQNYNLFKNKTILENVMLPMTLVQKKDKNKAEEEALRLIKQVGLIEKKDEFPSRLSGGQQQRIGIARALAVKPEVILFDEPTSSLDPELVGDILGIIKKLANQHECIMIIVTHEMRFAMEIADRIIFMEDGHIIEEGTPAQILRETKCERTKKFLQMMKNK